MFSSKSLLVLGCLLLIAAVILKCVMLASPLMRLAFKPSSLLILANTSFILALLRRK